MGRLVGEEALLRHFALLPAALGQQTSMQELI